MSFGMYLAKFRYALPSHRLGDLLAKPWFDTAIPGLILALTAAALLVIMPEILSPRNLVDTFRQVGEVGFITVGLTVVIIAGGIDLSVGAIYGLCSFLSVALIQGMGVPVFVAFPIVVATGGLMGLINGVLIGFFRMRAFLTTLATLIIGRAVLENLSLSYSANILSNNPGDLSLWYFVGENTVAGLPVSLLLLLIVSALTHVVLTRMRIGWHIQAVGGSRRSAHNAGLRVRGTVCLTYVFSGICCGFAGFLYAARLGNPGAEVGNGMEIVVLTAAVLGGNSLGGGRGSVAKALLGTIIVLFITGATVMLGLRSGGTNLVLGLALTFAVIFDTRWVKNRHLLASQFRISPVPFRLPPLPSGLHDGGSVLAANDILAAAEPVAPGKLDGPADIAFDSNDVLYVGSPRGEIVRLFPPDYRRHEVFAHIGGTTLGLAFDTQDTLYACVSGMGLYSVDRHGEPRKRSDQTDGRLLSVADDRRVRFPFAAAIAADGGVFYSEPTTRFDMSDWISDNVEMRANGRLLRYDPVSGKTETVLKDLIFPTGLCIEPSGQSLLFSETWAARVRRLWIDGPRKGSVETVLAQLPGFPAGIDRASDGSYWLALLGVRTPLHDLALESPGFRRHMSQRVAFDEWLYPNINVGLVIKFAPDGTLLASMWDTAGRAHSMVTSAREHKGLLFIGGLLNNRIGQIALGRSETGPLPAAAAGEAGS